MKKFATIFSIFLFLSFYINITCAFALPKTFSQGIYKFKDTGFSVGATYNVSNRSPNTSTIVIIFDANKVMQEFLRLEPNSPTYPIKPLDYNSLLIIVGEGDVRFS